MMNHILFEGYALLGDDDTCQSMGVSFKTFRSFGGQPAKSIGKHTISPLAQPKLSIWSFSRLHVGFFRMYQTPWNLAGKQKMLREEIQRMLQRSHGK